MKKRKSFQGNLKPLCHLSTRMMRALLLRLLVLIPLTHLIVTKNLKRKTKTKKEKTMT